MKNVVGLFENMRDAEAVVRDLRDAGINDADISFASRNPDAATMESNRYTAEGHSEAAEGAGFGATGGTIVGGLTGLLVGLGAIAIPGIGPVVAAGTLATALGSTALGAGIGAATGGLLGALVGAGIPEEDAHIYSEGIRRGGALVMAQVDDSRVDTALDIMERHNVVDIDERGTEYRNSGWSRFDENADPYSDTTYADRPVGDDEYDRSSKVGTAGGALAGAATGAALGSAGGPVGTVVGGVAGAVTGGAVGAAGDAAGVAASENDPAYGRTSDPTYDRSFDTGLTDYGATSAVGGVTDPAYSRSMDTTTNYDTTSPADSSYSTTGDTDSVPDASDYDRSSKVGTAGGAVAGAATGAAMGSVGGPVGTVVGGVAGAVTGGAVGAAGDAVGAEATDSDVGRSTSYDSTYRGTTDTGTAGTAYGSATDYGSTESTMGDAATRYRSRSYEVGGSAAGTPSSEGPIENMASRIENATERGIDADLDRDGDVGRRDPRDNY
ncbi:MAG TPA: hypothetical protein VGD69_21105 [Herpetosiphonaceae bacterium]